MRRVLFGALSVLCVVFVLGFAPATAAPADPPPRSPAVSDRPGDEPRLAHHTLREELGLDRDAGAAVAGVSPYPVYTWYQWGLDATYTNISQVMTPRVAPEDGHYFWAHQFFFADSTAQTGYLEGGYIGLQVGGSPNSTKQVRFSIWQATDAVALSPGATCLDFTGEGDGKTCVVDPYDFVEDHGYETTVTKSVIDDETWWVGSVRDTETGVTTPIGRIKVPPEWGDAFTTTSFMEHFWDPYPSCEDVIPARGTFALPRAQDGTVVKAFSGSGFGTNPTPGCGTGPLGGSSFIDEGPTSDHLMRPVARGQLRVTTTPALPAEISVDGAARDRWGLNWTAFPAGTHEVCFGPVAGYVAPPCESVELAEGEVAEVQGAYSQQGYLRAMTSPPLPSTVFVDGVERNDWGLWAEVEPGPHEVCFGAVAGFDPPACRTVDVPAGATATTTGTFVADAAAPGPAGPFGYLRATTDPAVGSMITVDGIWRNNWGLDWVKLSVGDHEVCFGPWIDLAAPTTCETVTLTDAGVSTVAGTYEAKGFLRVITSPAVHANVLVDGVVANAFGMWTAKAPGIYEVCFEPADGYATTPPCEWAIVSANTTTTVTGVFSP